ncbi:uncharacterized protein LOC115877775 [Sitophilus oryzae]|uniref:Uncharacterized protein LOC115877775 n=1 Tax=Sitophilus oryzae TaxID=7048 RepID=A0A6J2XF99_SITOR|nr:uncharacterized protein LOC115877775 [Sitophilus oryzae]
MGFYQNIQRDYGNHAMKLLKQWSNLTYKMASLKNRRIFLLKCRKNSVFPNHITHSIGSIRNLLDHHGGRLGSDISLFDIKVRRKILNLEIKITISDLNLYQKRIDAIYNNITNILPREIVNEFNNRLKHTFQVEFNRVKSINVNKYGVLISKVQSDIRVRDEWLRNISSTVIPDNVVKVLALGPKFNISPNANTIKIPELLSDLELAVSGFDKNKKDIVRGRFTNVIVNFLHGDSRKTHILSKQIKETKQFLVEHPELIVTLSDKGNVTVVMDRADYLNLSYGLLNDTKYYKPLPRDPTSTLEVKANKLISNFSNLEIIDKELAKSLKTYNSTAARYYGLPKIHKPALALRPIISSINSFNSKLEKYLTTVLTKAYNKSNPFYIDDSFVFCEFINEFQLPQNYVLVSLDVVSLFTNLPLDLAQKTIKDKWDTISPHTPFDLASFTQILNFVFDSTVFVFNDKFYKQIYGTPMGASISPIISSYVLDGLLAQGIERVPYNIPFIKRYVDDLILSVPMDMTDHILDVFNDLSDSLKFTIEREVDNSIPFLDMRLIRRPDNKIVTK